MLRSASDMQCSHLPSSRTLDLKDKGKGSRDRERDRERERWRLEENNQ